MTLSKVGFLQLQNYFVTVNVVDVIKLYSISNLVVMDHFLIKVNYTQETHNTGKAI